MKKPIRLFWGENYSQKPKSVLSSIQKATQHSIDRIHLYPGSLYQDAVQVIAEALEVKTSEIIFGHGIEGLIHLTSQTFLDSTNTGGMFKPSFYVYGDNLSRFNIITYPCHYAQKIDVSKFLKTIGKTQLFFLASPNTATGNYLLDSEEIEYVVKNYKGLFVVDECYYGLGKQTVIHLLKKYDNLLIYRGLSKVLGLASLRLGIACGNANIINKLSYNQTSLEADTLNTFSLNILIATFRYYEVLANGTKKFIIEFLDYIKPHFLRATFLKSLVTYQFMNIEKYKIPAYKVINLMNDYGYLLSDSNLDNNTPLSFPELIKFPPPPKEYWADFVETLKKALQQS